MPGLLRVAFIHTINLLACSLEGLELSIGAAGWESGVLHQNRLGECVKLHWSSRLADEVL